MNRSENLKETPKVKSSEKVNRSENLKVIRMEKPREKQRGFQKSCLKEMGYLMEMHWESPMVKMTERTTENRSVRNSGLVKMKRNRSAIRWEMKMDLGWKKDLRTNSRWENRLEMMTGFLMVKS